MKEVTTYIIIEFFKACREGNMIDVKNMVETYSFRQVTLDGCFVAACANGRLEVATFLFSRGVDIYAQDNAAFRFAMENGKHDITRFLLSKDPAFMLRASCTGLHCISDY